jgi:hypothetical protein
MRVVGVAGLFGCAVAAVAAVAVAASVLAKDKRDYSATGSHSAKSTVAAVNVGLVVLEVRIGLDMDRPLDCNL